ncbi:hypothetical protein J4226_02435 [Candidatus Pacearchaeota archaeon]|nr:hypothetical protein [Candidatus Pacearchaeota archaeon]
MDGICGIDGVVYGDVVLVEDDYSRVCFYSDCEMKNQAGDGYFETYFLKSYGVKRAGDILTIKGLARMIKNEVCVADSIDVTSYVPGEILLDNIISKESLANIMEKFGSI